MRWSRLRSSECRTTNAGSGRIAQVMQDVMELAPLLSVFCNAKAWYVVVEKNVVRVSIPKNFDVQNTITWCLRVINPVPRSVLGA